ncbi:MAG: RIP metalloprotease RseP [Thermoanaerobacteraceae bacterium]|nr:RIP metalloprotease RseP [Thermoanaerobacteraceae bacterium]
MGTIVISLVIFAALIVFHEFGHFIVAKLTGVKVIEFSVGMGPLLLSRDYKDTKYSLRLLPIGGYCQMFGEDGQEKSEGSFSAKSPFVRLLIIIAGPLMNLFLALLLFTIIGVYIGVPTTTIEKVVDNYPADQAGMKSGDEIIAINDTKIESWTELSEIISQSDSEKKLLVRRNDELIHLKLKPIYDEKAKRNIIGIEPAISHNFFVALKWGVFQVYTISKSILTMLGSLVLTGFNLSNFVGPVGVINIIGQVAKTGIVNLLNLSAVISINLGVFNILPIPALDGSRIFFILIEIIRGKPIEPEKENAVHFIGFILLLAFSALITYKDIINLSR